MKSDPRAKTTVPSFLLIGILCVFSAQAAHAEKVGLTVRMATYNTAGEIDTLLSNMVAKDIRWVCVSVKEDDSPQAGVVYYDSSIAPTWSGGWDIFNYFLTEAHKIGIEVWAWLPICHDDQVLLTHPDWAMVDLYAGASSTFCCPRKTDVRNYEKSIIYSSNCNNVNNNL